MAFTFLREAVVAAIILATARICTSRVHFEPDLSSSIPSVNVLTFRNLCHVNLIWSAVPWRLIVVDRKACACSNFECTFTPSHGVTSHICAAYTFDAIVILCVLHRSSVSELWCSNTNIGEMV